MKNGNLVSDLKKFGMKFGYNISLAIIISYTIILASIQRFWDTDFTSRAASNGLMLCVVIGALVFILIGPLIVDNGNLRVAVQILASVCALISVYYTMFDYLSFTEWIGNPPVMNFGYYWTYSLYPPLILFGAIFVLMIASRFDKLTEQSSENPPKNQKNGNNMIIYSAILIGIPWLIVGQFLQQGFFSTLIFFSIAVSVYLFVKVTELHQNIIKMKDTPEKDRENDRTKDRKTRILPQDLKNGFINVLKSIFGFLPFFGVNFANAAILSSILVKPSFIPLYLEFFPILLISGIIMGIFHKIADNRYLLVLISCILSVVISIILITEPYAYVLYEDLILWFCALSITGTFAAYELFSTKMVTGKFSRVFWAIFGIIASFGSYFYSTIIKWDLYDGNIVDQMVYFTLAPLVILFIAKLLANEVKENKKGTESTDGHKSDNIIQLKRKVQKIKWQQVLVACIMLGVLFIVPSIAYNSHENSQVEHVLASSNGDYYLWGAENTRSIDKNYDATLQGIDVNSTYRISAARGEHQGFQVVFTPGKVKNLNLKEFEVLADLNKTSTGATIDKGNVTIYSQSYVTQLNEQYPDHLHPFERLDTGLNLRGQKNYPFYVDVAIPRDESIESGVYSTTIKFRCWDYHVPFPGEPKQYNERTVYFDLEVEVYNFTVELERHINMEIIWNIKDNDAWRDFYGDYRLDPYWPDRPVVKYNSTIGNLSIEFNFTRWLSDLDYGFNNGMSYYPITWLPPGLNWSLDALDFTESFETMLTWYINNITDQLAGKKTPWGSDYLDHAYFFIRDEPIPVYYDVITDVAEVIHAANSSVKIMETMNQPLDTYPNDFLTEIDLYCMHIHQWFPSESYPDDDEVNKWPTKLRTFLETYSGPREKELWIYHTHNRFPSPDTEIYMNGMLQRSMLWLHWIYNVDTYLYWSFNWGTDTDAGYGYAGYGESTLVGFGENDDPLSSLRLERIRDGIEDYEYFWILNDTCNQLDDAGQSSEAVTGRNLLEQVSQMFNQPEHWSHFPNYNTEEFEGFKWSYNPYRAQYIELRNAVGEELTRINSLGIL